MAIDPAILSLVLSVAKFGYDIFKDLKSRGGVSDQQRQEAREAFLTALRETKGYLELLQTEAEPTPERQHQLSELWQQASRKMRDVNPALSDRLFTKAEYWMQPESWSPEDVQEARIGFESIRSELEGLRSA